MLRAAAPRRKNNTSALEVLFRVLFRRCSFARVGKTAPLPRGARKSARGALCPSLVFFTPPSYEEGAGGLKVSFQTRAVVGPFPK